MIPSYFSPLFDHLCQSTIVAAVVAMLVLALRRNRAHTRHWLWLIASVKFLVPFSLLVAIGSRVGQPIAPAIEPAALSMLVGRFEPSLAQTQPHVITIARVAGIPTNFLPGILITVWFVGCAGVLVRWLASWKRIRAAMCAASPLPFGLNVPVLSAAGLLEPGVFGIWRPVLLLPEGITEHLAPAELAAILTHELCHVRRCDNIAAVLHMVVEAIFWFHPLVWWIGARLVEERERACDEEVLRLGSDPTVYAESILKTCQFYLESPLVCMSGVTGSDLKIRIERIMTRSAIQGLNRGKKLLLTGMGFTALAGPIMLGLLSGPRGVAQSEGNSTKRLSFDIISIRPAAPLRASTPFGNDFKLWYGPDSHVILSNVTLKFLIKLAYKLRDDQIAEGPSWFGLRHFDIDAKCDPPIGGDPRKLSFEERNAYNEQLNLRIQSLLADRFHLQLRQEAKEEGVFDLVVAKNGPKFQESPPVGSDVQAKRGSRVAPGHIEVYPVNMSIVARMLSDFAGRTVIDRIGLKGSYDFKLDWAPRSLEPVQTSPDTRPATEVAAPSLFTAVQEQLGLKLESDKGPVPFLLVERATLPDAN